MSPYQPTSSTSLSLPEDTYIYTLVPTSHSSSLSASSLTLAALASNNSVSVFHAHSAGLPISPLLALNDVHQGGATCLVAHGDGVEDVLITAGRNGAVRCWDVRTGKIGLEMWDHGGGSEKTDGLSALAWSPHAHFIAAGGEVQCKGNKETPIYVWDTRNAKTLYQQFNDFHSDIITELQFNTHSPRILLSASTDGLVSLIDTGFTPSTSADATDDALLQVLNHGSAVQHAGFLSSSSSSARSQVVYALSHDERLAFYEVDSSIFSEGQPNAVAGRAGVDGSGGVGVKEEDEERPLGKAAFGDVRERVSGCAYVVNLWKDERYSDGVEGAVMAVGDCGSQSLTLHHLSNKNRASWQLDVVPDQNSHSLPGAHGEEIVRDLYTPDNYSTIFTCGEDGRVRAWKAPEEQTETRDVKMEDARGVKSEDSFEDSQAETGTAAAAAAGRRMRPLGKVVRQRRIHERGPYQ